MGFFDFGSSSESSKTETRDMTPGIYRRLRPLVADSVRDIAATGGPTYGGAFAAQMSPEEMAALGAINAGGSPTGDAARSMLNQTTQSRK